LLCLAEEIVLKVIADHREAKSGVPELLRARGACVEISQLPLGDFIVSDRVCVERKRRSDFEQSIMDGRLFSQAARLSAECEKPIIIVEGERFEERVSRAASLGAVCSLILDFGINVFFTRDAEKTCELILALAKREQLASKRPVRVLGSKRAFSIPQQQRMIVEALPGVGPTLAVSLLKQFKTVEKVMKASEEKLQKVEKIGPEKAKAIRKLLTGEFSENNEGDCDENEKHE